MQVILIGSHIHIIMHVIMCWFFDTCKSVYIIIVATGELTISSKNWFVARAKMATHRGPCTPCSPMCNVLPDALDFFCLTGWAASNSCLMQLFDVVDLKNQKWKLNSVNRMMHKLFRLLCHNHLPLLLQEDKIGLLDMFQDLLLLYRGIT